MSEVELKGSALVLMLYDVCEEIRLDELRRILGAQPAERSPSFKHPAPEYVRFERPPVVEPLERVTLETGEQLEGRLKYYDYGVVCVELSFSLKGDGTCSSTFPAGILLRRKSSGMHYRSPGKSRNGLRRL